MTDRAEYGNLRIECKSRLKFDTERRNLHEPEGKNPPHGACLGGRCSALLSAALYRLFPARGPAIRQPDPACSRSAAFPRDPALCADLVQRPLLLGCSDLPDVGLYPDPQLFSPGLFSGDRFGRSGVRPVCGCRAGVPSCGTAGDAMHGVGGLWRSNRPVPVCQFARSAA